MLNHIFLIYLSVLIPFMNSIELAELTPSPCGDEHCLYCDYKHLRYCNDCQIAQTTTISGFKHCQTECYANQYGRYNNTSVEECMFCDRACEGCNGPLQVVEEKMGCKRCKVGIYEGEMKKCLHSENSQTICSDNGHKNYYRDTSNSSEKLWTDSICRECHSTCSSCSSYTNDPITCVCKLFKKTDGSTSECSNFCPSDYRKLQIEHEPYQTCIKCPEGYELNVITGKCDKEVSIWSW
uniref:Uncharacterized protein n=1 Tax=Acrobeloides nanus TaxID=290746 RepID=A0A914EQ69_9BILA